MMVSGAEFASYRFRYLRADGTFARVAELRCANDGEALRRAAGEDPDCVALEISCGNRLVWCGLREDAVAVPAD
jgi:hypothetical protein